MANVEKALRDSINLYRENYIFIIPHLVESILTFLIFLSMAFTVVMAIGVHVVDIAFSDSPLLASQIKSGGIGLVSIIIITVLFGVFLALIVKAGATVGVIGMVRQGSKGGEVAVGRAIEDVKKHVLEIFLFWIVAGAIFVTFIGLISLPIILAAVIGLSETVAIALTFFAFLVTLMFAIVFYVSVMFTPQYIVVADAGVIGSMKKSIGFVRRNVSATILYLAVYLIFSLFLLVFLTVLSLLSNLFYMGSQFLGVFVEIFLNIFTIGLSLLIAPYFEMVKTGLILEQASQEEQ